MGKAAEVKLLYQQVLTLGERVLLLLGSPLSGERIGELTQALQERRLLLERADSLARSEEADEGLGEIAAELLRQQKALEGALAGQLQRMRQTAAQSRQSRAALQGVQRILNGRSRSQLVDQRR